MKIVVSFSGGKTSAHMLKKYIDAGEKDLVVLFANTGQEHPKTLDFVNRCSLAWGINTVWLEAITHHDKRMGCSHKQVSYETATRQGEPFEQMIMKYGIPNKAYPHCTRELKLNPIYSYLKSEGITDFQMAIGIRADEDRRAMKKAKRGKIVYPLIDNWPTTKRQVNDWWSKQPFNLDIPEHMGNCTWCWKKSMKKHFSLIESIPESFDFPRRMEAEHGLSGHNIDGTKRVFFRGNMSTEDLFELYADETAQNPQIDLNCNDGCSDSCDIHAEMAPELCSGV